jgi:flagellar biosynthesis chaperone FliJ
MRTTKNSDRLRDILMSTRNQIVALQDIKIEMLAVNKAIAGNIQQQIDALEEVYKHQLTLVQSVHEIEPKKSIWFSGNLKPKEDRFSAIMD